MRHLTVLLLSAAALYATPQMRLSSSTIGPLNIVVGQNGTTQTVTTSNIGDSTALSLTAASSVSWITPTIAGTSVQMALNTSTLAAGIFTGIVTVTAAGAIDSPQTITVTVQMGGGVPNSINLYVAPGGAASASFTASSQLNATATPPAGLGLTITSEGGGSFATTASYVVTATAPASITPETSYSGKISVISSGFTPDVKVVPVTVNVTDLPIVALTPTSLQFNVALGASPVMKWIELANSGATALTISGATVSAGTNNSVTSWLTTSISGSTVVLTSNPSGLAIGAYTATVTIATNAKNGPLTVPVEMDVVAVGPPVSYFQGVVDNALYQVGGTVAPGGLVLVRGDQFTMGPAVSATTLPLGTSLGNATVYVNGVAAPIYYTAAYNVVNPGGQITFQMPYNTPSGQATIRVDRNDNGTVQTGNTVSVPVAAIEPRLLQFALNGTEYAIATFTDYVTFPIPVTAGIASRPAKPGDTLIFYGLGFGQTTPAVTEGVVVAGAPTISSCLMVFGQSVLPGANVYSTPSYCGLTPGSVGLYQVNVTVPANTPAGSAVPVFLQIGTNNLSNAVAIAVN